MPVTKLDLRVREIAIAEWWHFGGQYVKGDVTENIRKIPSGTRSTGIETNTGFQERTWTYCKQGVYPTSNQWRAFKSSAWSASFISFCMRQAGAGPSFPYSVGHSTYVNQAVRNQLRGLTSNTITAHSKKDIVPEAGDLLWKMGYKKWSTWSHGQLVNHVKNGGGGYNSHCDIVTEVDHQKGFLYAIGGNVSDRVLRFKIKLNDDGLIKTKRYATIIKNSITE